MRGEPLLLVFLHICTNLLITCLLRFSKLQVVEGGALKEDGSFSMYALSSGKIDGQELSKSCMLHRIKWTL